MELVGITADLSRVEDIPVDRGPADLSKCTGAIAECLDHLQCPLDHDGPKHHKDSGMAEPADLRL